MRTVTVILAAAALRHGGLRAAARACGQPLSTVTAALDRMETELGLPLTRRTETGLALTLEARRHVDLAEAVAAACVAVHGQPCPSRGVGFEALFRLAAVLRAGSIRGAALSLGLAQPHLTRQMAQVEATLGRPLMRRHRSGITATPEGLALLPIIDQLRADWDRLTTLARLAAPPQSQRYTLGTIIPGTPGGDLATLIGRIARDVALRQGAQLAITASPAGELLAGLDAARFDAVIVDIRTTDPGYRQHALSHGRLAMFGQDMPADPAMTEPLRAALRRQPVALQTRQSGLRQRAEAFLDRYAGADWRSLTRVIEVDSLPVIVRLVRDRDVSAVLPIHPSLQLPPEMTMLLPEAFDQTIWLTWRARAKSDRLAARIIAL